MESLRLPYGLFLCNDSRQSAAVGRCRQQLPHYTPAADDWRLTTVIACTSPAVATRSFSSNAGLMPFIAISQSISSISITSSEPSKRIGRHTAASLSPRILGQAPSRHATTHSPCLGVPRQSKSSTLNSCSKLLLRERDRRHRREKSQRMIRHRSQAKNRLVGQHPNIGRAMRLIVRK
jgi:hypothetical protein